MTETTKQTLRNALFEAAFVVLGVVLALAANEWREERGRRALAAHALEAIREEMAVNRAAVGGARAYHATLQDSLHALARRGAETADMRLFARGFAAPASVLSTAWQTAVATDAVSHMDYDDVLAVSRLYDRQTAYEEQARIFGDVIYARLYDDGIGQIAHNYRNLSSIISTFWYREGELLAAYDSTLTALGAPAANAPAETE